MAVDGEVIEIPAKTITQTTRKWRCQIETPVGVPMDQYWVKWHYHDVKRDADGNESEPVEKGEEVRVSFADIKNEMFSVTAGGQTVTLPGAVIAALISVVGDWALRRERERRAAAPQPGLPGGGA